MYLVKRGGIQLFIVAAKLSQKIDNLMGIYAY
jgi:hypothetical protein